MERTRLDLKLSKEQRAALEHAAHSEGVTISQYVMDALKLRIPDFPDKRKWVKKEASS